MYDIVKVIKETDEEIANFVYAVLMILVYFYVEIFYYFIPLIGIIIIPYAIFSFRFGDVIEFLLIFYVARAIKKILEKNLQEYILNL